MSAVALDTKQPIHAKHQLFSSGQLTALLIIALFSMAIDHAAFVYYGWAHWLHIPGRVAFPLFCFLLAYNFHFNTQSRMRYLARIFLAFILSQPFFYYFFDVSGSSETFSGAILENMLLSYLKHPNIMLTLLAGGVLIVIQNRYSLCKSWLYKIAWLCTGSVVIFPFLTPGWDYSIFGPLLILLIFMLLNKPQSLVLITSTTTLAFCVNLPYLRNLADQELQIGVPLVWLCLAGVIGLCASISAIYLLHHIQVKRLPRYFTYTFYPAHMAFFSLLSPGKLLGL